MTLLTNEQAGPIRRLIGSLILRIAPDGVYLKRHRAWQKSEVRLDLDQVFEDARGSRYVMNAAGHQFGRYDVLVTDDVIQVKPHGKGPKWFVSLSPQQAYMAAQQYNRVSTAEKETRGVDPRIDLSLP